MPTVITANCFRLLNARPLWSLRKAKLVSVLESASPDIVCVQECTETQERYILTELDGAWGSASDYVNVGVMYRSDRYERISQRPLRLANKTAGNRKRYASAAVLESYEDGSRLGVLSAHLASSGDGNAAASRPFQAEQILTQLDQWGQLGLPWILAGDWNESALDKGVAAVFLAAGFTEDRALLNQPGKAIDRFFMNSQVTPTEAAVLPSNGGSDHNFRRMTFYIGDPPPPEPPAFPVKMYVRPLGDPIWKAPPFELTARNARGEFIKPPIVRPAGAEVTGVVVDLINDKFVNDSGEHYRMSYLTTERPALPVEPEPVEPEPVQP